MESSQVMLQEGPALGQELPSLGWYRTADCGISVHWEGKGKNAHSNHFCSPVGF